MSLSEIREVINLSKKKEAKRKAVLLPASLPHRRF
jgi:hypothetical protein